MPFGPIKTALAVVGASIVSYYTISPAAKAVFGNNDGEGDGKKGEENYDDKNKQPPQGVNVTKVKAVRVDGAVSGDDPVVVPGKNKDVEGVASGDGQTEDNEQEESGDSGGAADNSQAEARAEEGEGDQ